GSNASRARRVARGTELRRTRSRVRVPRVGSVAETRSHARVPVNPINCQFFCAPKRAIGLTGAREEKFEACFPRRPERDSNSLKSWSHRAAHHLYFRYIFRGLVTVARCDLSSRVAREFSGSVSQGDFLVSLEPMMPAASWAHQGQRVPAVIQNVRV